jgi:SAM-dependent methyltransferase
VLDVGCGNGSLLLALRELWPDAVLRGLDPSHESVAHARDAGVDAKAGNLEDVTVEPSELVVSVNVVEHTRDPARFIERLGAALAANGTLVLVCPDGSQPSTELVFADHLSSFAPVHLERLLHRSGLVPLSAASAPTDLGNFQMIVARRDDTTKTQAAMARVPRFDAPPTEGRRAYLDAWRALDRLLAERGGTGPLVCFGIGEAAGLLRAYAPTTWGRVTACVADTPEQPTFGDLPVLEYSTMQGDAAVLLGVRPAVQPAVAARVQNEGRIVVRWDDVIRA